MLDSTPRNQSGGIAQHCGLNFMMTSRLVTGGVVIKIWRVLLCISLFAMVYISSVSSLMAGELFKVWCTEKDCGFTETIANGPGMNFNQLGGYCRKCNKWVSIGWSWKSGTKPPVPLAKFWDPTTGRQREVYSCPNCTLPFVSVPVVQEFRYCLKCGKQILKSAQAGFYD